MTDSDKTQIVNEPAQAGPSRREFLALGGGIVGAGAMGFNAGWAQNDTMIDVASVSNTSHETDVLVIGGGMAGLFAAVKAHDAGASVLMVAKGRLGSSGLTPFAKGFFAYDPAVEDMSLDEFTDAVSHSALGTNNPVYTRQTAEHSLACAKNLEEWGFFESNLYNASFSKPISARNIPVVERVMMTHLLKDGERIAGAAGFRLDAEEIVTFTAKSVILCTGAGGFKPNGFPVCDLTHDGTIMAYNIGAKVTGKEWNDGHPARTVYAAATYDGWGDMFDQVPNTLGIGVRHDLGVELNYAAYVNGNPIQGGPGSPVQSTAEGGPYRPTEFSVEANRGGGAEESGDRRSPPNADNNGPSDGPPPGMSSSPVGGASAGMAIHKSEGLVPINERCASNVPGLFAAGDALGSHMCGGIYTQIGSSLAGSAVQGAIAGEASAEYASSVEVPAVSSETLANVEDEILAPLKREAGYGPAWVTQTLQGIMIPNFVLYIKKESLLRAALSYIEELRDHHMPMLRASDLHELRLAHETANMIISAEMKLRASLMRTESRCSHFRLDYPEVDDENWRCWINIYKDEKGSMRLEKQAFDAWPAQAQ